MKNRKPFFMMFLFLLCGYYITAQQTAEKFIQETHYLLALPEGYDTDTSRRWPLLIFLHGSGESGNDIEKVKAHGPPKLVGQGKKFPFIVVSPQAPPGMGWQDETLYQLIQNVKNSRRVDPLRIYLTGLSMGGYGTWSLAIKHPEEFAAIAPVCGGGDTTEIWKLRNVAIWNFHGAKDDVVLPAESEKMVKAARRYNANVKYTLYPDANHNSWDATYSNDSLYTWLLAQTKFRYKEVPVSPDLLKTYAGKYVGPDKDTVVISVENLGLIAKTSHGENIPLKSAGKDMFFIEPGLPFELQFIHKNGKVNSFLFMGNNRSTFRKL